MNKCLNFKISIVSRLLAGVSGAQISESVQDFCRLLIVQTICEANTAPYSIETGVLFPGVKPPERDAEQ